jgi:Zn-finger nucleic acid-binding protein
MKCPHCQDSDLRPTLIEQSLPAMGCATCHGSLVSLLYDRHWAETRKPAAADAGQPAAPSAAAPVPTVPDTTRTILCPKCSRLMTKYRLAGGVANRVDVCNACDEAWLDGGEWELLEALQLSLSMPAIFTEAWQRRLRRELSDDTRRGILTRLIGTEGAARVEEFRLYLGRSGHKSHILNYLYHD